MVDDKQAPCARWHRRREKLKRREEPPGTGWPVGVLLRPIASTFSMLTFLKRRNPFGKEDY
ncbi:hypothetical protein Bwad005_04210 [Bilophila wadsworthia]